MSAQTVSRTACLDCDCLGTSHQIAEDKFGPFWDDVRWATAREGNNSPIISRPCNPRALTNKVFSSRIVFSFLPELKMHLDEPKNCDAIISDLRRGCDIENIARRESRHLF
jgi:hypothetical protein